MVKQMEDRHSIWIRIFHWTNMIAITMLCLTGFYIHAPESFRLFANMDNARMIHFGMAYLLCVGVLGRVYYAIVADDAKNIVFSVTKDTPKFPSMMKYYLFMADSHPYYGKYNPGQKMMYTGWLFMALIQIITGFVLYKPDMFMAVSGWLGGYMAVRVIHYIVTWLFVLSVLAHVYLDISEGVPVLKSMFTGKIPADFDHGTHEEQAPAQGESIGA
ncbi:Ni/Fe-hydrogenase, b-type cytochrome subunit [Syntrophomonas wolfei]|jgi:Ni/Fe-hydrogenase 1 B-type cytochrome subunit|uniref:Ni/Fe-hydrogenase, b-type cytochrome subunit n=1 Tax=Syntrophomonas wolfei TaxID=863 RepID=UPI0023F3EBC8|nr:Ni/Fe-hydrogenase, b-type cytochrome subunit [Syntrophomonas wolfei]